MKGIGYWKEENIKGLTLKQRIMNFLGFTVELKTEFIHEYANPKNLTGSTLSKEEQQNLIEFLKTGKVYCSWLGFSYCRFDCGIDDSKMGASDLSDGTWAWPEGLVHYVEEHDLRLPEEFVAHARQAGFKIDENIELRKDALIDTTFWDDWCARQERSE